MNQRRYGSVISGTREPTTVVMHSVNSSSAKDKRNGPPPKQKNKNNSFQVTFIGSVTDVRYSTKSPRDQKSLKRPWILPVPFRKSAISLVESMCLCGRRGEGEGGGGGGGEGGGGEDDEWLDDYHWMRLGAAETCAPSFAWLFYRWLVCRCYGYHRQQLIHLVSLRNSVSLTAARLAPSPLQTNSNRSK